MIQFKQKQIAVAVLGAALTIAAGSANAALPTLRTAGHSTLISTVNGGAADADIKAMLNTTGLINKAITIDITMNSGVAGSSTGGVCVATGDTVNGTINAVIPGCALVVNDTTTLANNHIVFYTGTKALGTQLAGTSAVLGATVAGVAHIAVAMPAPGANKGYRITAGALEYCADTSIATPVWAAVKMDLQVVAGGTNLYTESNAGAGLDAGTEMIAITGTVVETSLAPTPVVATIGAPTAASPLINGISVDTIVPIDAFTIVTNVAVTPVDPGGVFAAVDTATNMSATATGMGAAFTTASATATLGAAVAATATLPPTFKNTVTVLGAADWTNGPAADDLIFAASPIALNTGIVGSTLPLALSAGPTAPKYTQVFNTADGVGKTVAFHATTAANGQISAATASDGVAPVIVANGITFSTPTAAATPLTNLSATFSENMTLLTGDDLREVLENVKVGTATLAALSLNSGAVPTLAALAGNKLTTDKLTINSLVASDVATLAAGVYTGKSISVEQGITFQEVNDSAYSATVPAIDFVGALVGAYGEALKGGIKSASNAVEAVAAVSIAQTAVVPPTTVVWGTDTSALASASSATNTDQIDTITVTFGQGKSVMLRPLNSVVTPANLTAATAADLAANLVIDVKGTNGVTFQVKPTAATLTTTAAGISSIAITIPTALIYSKLNAANGTRLTAMYVGYVGNNVLVATSSTLAAPIVVTAGTTVTAGVLATDLLAAGAEPVVLPLVFTASQTGGQSTLMTQSIQTNVVGAAAGSKVTAYLARWEDAPAVSIGVPSLTAGKITNPGDRVATDLAIEFADAAALGTLIQTELKKVAAPKGNNPGISNPSAAVAAKPINAYVMLVRSNDTAAIGAQTGSQTYLNARAVLASTATAARTAADSSNDTASPVYEVQLHPVTGAITGRLTGNITISANNTDGTRGLVFLDAKGADGAATVIGSTLLAAKSATGLALPGTANMNLLVGIDPGSNDFNAVAAKKPFVLLVHQDSTGKYTMLTSADQTAANYLPFTPDLLNMTVGTGVNAGVVARAATPLSVTDTKAFDMPASANWALFGIGNPASKAVAGVVTQDSFARKFVGLDTATGTIQSYWTNAIAADADMAMTMAGNAIGVATELSSDSNGNTGPTLSNIGAANTVAGAVGMAWSNQKGATDGASAKLGKVYVAQATGAFAPNVAVVPKFTKTGWSLVTVPAAGTLGAVVDAVIKVGAQVGTTTATASDTAVAGKGTGQFTWFAIDGAMPTLTPGEAVFVHAKAAGNL